MKKTILYSTLGLLVSFPLLASADIYGFGSGYGMMGYGGGEGSFLMVACMIIWTVVGILASVWLWQNINKK